MKKNTAYLSIGSNLGEPIANCERGISRLVDDGRVSLVQRSGYYYTEPIGYENQPWFVNAVLAVATDLSPPALLRRLKRIEKECGRTDSGIRFGPRMLDLDIIFYDGITMDTPELTLPHPRMHQRLFVLRPLCDIAPDIVHPELGLSMERLHADLAADGQQCRPVSDAPN